MKLVLVTGCPRSGTTAVASWLLSAPGAVGAIETRRTIAARSIWRTSKRFWCFDPMAPLMALQRATNPELVRQIAREAALRMYGVSQDHDGVLIDKEPLEPVAFPQEDYAEYLQDVRDLWDAQLVCMVRNPIDTIASMMRRLWGYSAKDQEPHELALRDCIRVWKKATRAVIRAKVVAPAETRIQTYEALCSHPEIETQKMMAATGLILHPFLPRQSNHGPFDPHVVEETAWERQILTCYDGRPLASPRVVLLTGEPGVGKTSIAKEVAATLNPDRTRVVVLDGDDMRRRLWPELPYDVPGRAESTRRALALATSVSAAGAVVLVSMVAPHEEVRRKACEEASRAGVTTRIVRVTAPEEVRLNRRPRVAGADVHDFAYEEPSAPNAVIDSGTTNIAEAAALVLKLI
jgi:adenylylsulfate kinase